MTRAAVDGAGRGNPTGIGLGLTRYIQTYVYYIYKYIQHKQGLTFF